MIEAGTGGAGARGSAKGLLRIVGYVWIAFFAAVLMVTAGVDWLADLRPGTTPLDFSRWTYLEEIAGMIPGVLAVLLTRLR